MRAAANGGICVFAGKRPPADLPLLLASADVLASPRCRGTNTPFKLYTYLAAGRPMRIPRFTNLFSTTAVFVLERVEGLKVAG